ncbi:hypothetical protein AXG93_1713s1050 [Marchantia polymorpha subsp. ruderalis]|uniref:Uncharacterized protein n=1 Tax=Marchantia polymorpha subsp. ruderalis TaxID=1480154 RepID=A0A176VT81_MARPO|nr:hypothetical protein AXG93_1713s1050 [Marchantia polymorpha subsp. ruderalis]
MIPREIIPSLLHRLVRTFVCREAKRECRDRRNKAISREKTSEFENTSYMTRIWRAEGKVAPEVKERKVENLSGFHIERTHLTVGPKPGAGDSLGGKCVTWRLSDKYT